jgi:hypothetical protein
VDALAALGAVAVTVVMWFAVGAADRLDRYLRTHDMEWLVVGPRGYAVFMKWFFRAVIAACGLFFVVLFFQRI